MLSSDRQLCESFSSFSHDNATTVLLCFLIPYVWPSSFLHSEREKGKKRGLECSKNKGCNFAAGFTSEQERKRVGGKKPKLSTTNWDHQTDGWPFWAKLCICLGISPESNSVQTLQRPSSDEATNQRSFYVRIHMQKAWRCTVIPESLVLLPDGVYTYSPKMKGAN